MDYGFRIPGTEGPDLVIRRSDWTGVSVRLDGVKLKPTGRPRAWTIPLPDGTVKTLRVTGQYTGMRVLVDGVEFPLEPAIPRWTTILMLLPLVLVIGGLIGGAIGIVGILINRVLSTARLAAPLKAVAMIAVTVVGVGIWLGVGIAITPLPKLAVGQCLNGLREGGTVTSANTRPVDCAKPHDNEVVGLVEVADQKAFPGDQVMVITAQAQCVPQFATYVGIDFNTSTLILIPIVPTETSWTTKGDRTIACVVASGDATQMTGSVKGSKK